MPCCSGPGGCKDFDPDREGVGEADLARFGGDEDDEPAAACPECGAGMYHDAAVCASCGLAVTPGYRGVRGRRWVAIVAVVALIGMLLGYVLWRL